MHRICRDGTFANTQTRESFINGAMETGMRDNEITSVTGQRSAAALLSYKNPSLAFKKASSERMVHAMRSGSTTWHDGFQQNRPVCRANREEALVLRTQSQNQMVRTQTPAPPKLIFGRKRKLVQEPVSKRDLYQLSENNQQLFNRMLTQQSQLMMMNEKHDIEDSIVIENNDNSLSQNVFPKRRFGKSSNTENNIRKPKTRSKLAA